MRFSYAVLPVLMRLRLQRWLPAGIRSVKCQNVEQLVDLYQDFQAGKIRLLIAFRHVEVDDPLSMAYLLSRIVPQVARQQGIALQRPIHSYFMYDRGMPLWAGQWLGWIFSRLGGVPVHRGRRLDSKALKATRERLLNGHFPFTIAPEGATNGHSEIVSPLEPGAAQLAFWCVQDLQDQKRPEDVVVLPISIQYEYPHPNWRRLDQLMGQLEADSGLAVKSFAEPDQASPDAYYQRLLRLGQHLLAMMEQFYDRSYPVSPSEATERASPRLNENEQIAQRLQQLLEEALRVGEQYFGLPSTGSMITRCRRLEEAGWSQIYREDLPNLATLSPLEQGLADWTAETARIYMRHMRLVESFVAVTGRYVREKPSFERFAETVLILFDLVERLKGVKVPKRPRLGWRQAVIRIGHPIGVTERWSSYCCDRQSAKQAVTSLTQDIQQSLEKLIQ